MNMLKIVALPLSIFAAAFFVAVLFVAALPDQVFAAAPAREAKGAAAMPATAVQLKLPEPTLQGGMPLMQALSLRKSTRSFSREELSMRQISDMLWAAFGRNRPDGRRTIPTAMNRQNLILYVALPNGVWRYDPDGNELLKESDENLSDSLGGAPCTIGYAAEGKFGGLHAGSAYQNVGLYCASAGLANVVKATGVDIMKKQVKLPAGYDLLIIQSIGRP